MIYRYNYIIPFLVLFWYVNKIIYARLININNNKYQIRLAISTTLVKS